MNNPIQNKIHQYYEDWNLHNTEAICRYFSKESHYRDSVTDGSIQGELLRDYFRRWLDAFPDLRFDVKLIAGSGQSYFCEWLMTGTNQKAFFTGVDPTQAVTKIEGVTHFEMAEDSFLKVHSYFDQKALAESMGLMVLVQPFEQAGAKFGYSMRVHSFNKKPPGVIALTWIQAANEDEKARIRQHSKENVKNFKDEPGFISIVTGFTGLRGFTVTAWEDEASMKRALSGHHATAMKELFSTNFVSAVWTGVWAPTRINRLWVRCPQCSSLEDVSNENHKNCSSCNHELPERPLFW